MPGKEKKKRAPQRTPAKNAKKCRNISDMFKRLRKFSVVFEPFPK